MQRHRKQHDDEELPEPAVVPAHDRQEVFDGSIVHDRWDEWNLERPGSGPEGVHASGLKRHPGVGVGGEDGEDGEDETTDDHDREVTVRLLHSTAEG